MTAAVPALSPFGFVEFARFWEGWRGRTCVDLEVGDFSFPYVRRTLGLLYSNVALPFGTPVLVNDRDPRQALWIERFFDLGRSYASALTLYEAPSRPYRGVSWTTSERSVVALDGKWQERVDAEVKRRSRRARESGWEVRALRPEELERAGEAVTATSRRHAQGPQFSLPFYVRLQQAISEPGRLVVWGAVRAEEIGGFRIVFKTSDYAVSWALCLTDAARLDHVGPYLTYAWLSDAAAAGCHYADLGVSLSAGVQRFKAAFGARAAWLHTGMRRWHLRGT